MSRADGVAVAADEDIEPTRPTEVWLGFELRMTILTALGEDAGEYDVAAAVAALSAPGARPIRSMSDLDAVLQPYRLSERVRLMVEYSDRPGEVFPSRETFADEAAAIALLRQLAGASPLVGPYESADRTWRLDLTGPAEGWARFRVVPAAGGDVCAECEASSSGICSAHPWPGMSAAAAARSAS